VNDVAICHAALSEQHRPSSPVRGFFAASAMSPLRRSTESLWTATVIAGINDI
jgi:hypothetical protein